MKFLSVVGARPQFVKASPLSVELRREHQEILVHTGQHYDADMSDVFFDELGIPAPEHHLGIGSGPHGAQTGAMLGAIEEVILAERPDVVIVYGDTNSTLAGALAAAKLHVPVAHVEAGLRSFNRRMPEEINRIVADHVSTWLFAPSESSAELLGREGISDGVHVVGDIMLDAVLMHRPRAIERSAVLERLGLDPGAYYLATVHRAENTDDPARLRTIFETLGSLDRQVVLPAHPRTQARLRALGFAAAKGLRLIEPVGYLDMLRLQSDTACILTDSGGVQKEAYYLGVPCVTLRDETEWTETVDAGWNVLTGADRDRIVAALQQMRYPPTLRPRLYGDGQTAARILGVLVER